ncbi:SDR family NAD(P)-dependent oxidoreductase [Futiania mangrovi]|uniref:SDR family oxidoreductase n=1 Tax=Futiania mangrovi TaxID=2959716 RepID=A0A9J6PCY0_9PROT|nr:SDR family oxidoreductase [Futiania mangrovii]MCP1335523.1 SDR family oxidoreductase [Futiania mangrovii]
MAVETVFVAGGGRGVGRACCLEFASQGANVAFIYHSNEQAAEETRAAIEAAGGKGLALRADIRDRAQIERAFAASLEAFGPLDTFVHTAGSLVKWTPVRDHDPNEWVDFIATDLCGAFHTIQSAVRQMRQAGKGGAVLAISSIAAQMCQPKNSQGAAAKAGLEALIRVLAKEEGRHGIRANAVSIGLTDTDMTADARAAWGDEAIERIIKGFPIQRIGQPEEIARVVRFLCGPDGAYITGKVLQVDGGQFIAG